MSLTSILILAILAILAIVGLSTSLDLALNAIVRSRRLYASVGRWTRPTFAVYFGTCRTRQRATYLTVHVWTWYAYLRFSHGPDCCHVSCSRATCQYAIDAFIRDMAATHGTRVFVAYDTRKIGGAR